MKTVKPKSCKICGVKFIPFTSTAVVCGFRCAEEYAKRSRDRREASLKRTERVKTKKAIEAIQPKSYWLKKAQTVFNKYIRMRDDDQACISCQKPMHKKINAGHFRSVGSSPHLRFNENNCHAQCEHCNNYLSGNIGNYRINLIKKIGESKVIELECDNKPKHYTVDDIKKIILKYKNRIKELNDLQ